MSLDVTEVATTVPAEWAPQKCIWTAWPADAARVERRSRLTTARRGGDGARARRPPTACGCWSTAPRPRRRRAAAVGDAAELVPARYGDIWLRDTGPIFARGAAGAVALRFKTNSWGGKYDLPDDATVGDDIARLAGAPVRRFDFVLEGGAVDHDGEGTILTTRQTLLNANRNGWSKTQAEAALRRGLRRPQCHLDRRGPDQRSHRRPHRQHRALRRAGPRRLPGACRRRRSQRRDARRHRAHARARVGCARAPARGRAHSRRRALPQRARRRSRPPRT